uniref:Uncharacterized protein n=1 Tax=Arundo donax TaxID=35708 RepID=A0A0A9BU66_ARUDO
MISIISQNQPTCRLGVGWGQHQGSRAGPVLDFMKT